ncbi:autotransporter adhesin BigA [Salmonella enterica]|nr:autotransporter adhesin BigA [Salmonella enterica]ELW4535624.1 autotransporter adhesin BigA [Salmonella enterica]ELX9051400.1 autotransporter adhesin BigA [Salmonella enterica]
MNPMQKKKLISIAIALTLQSYYIPAIAAENNDDEKECPSNISSLPKEKRAKLSPTCLATPENDNHWGWVAGGVAALVAGVAIGVENNGGGDSNHSYTPPTPDNGGDVTPPDDSGDDDVTPPDDSGDDDVTPPDDSGDDDVTPPDDSGDGDVTPPDDSGDDDVTPPDDSGDDDVTPPDDSGDDDVTPPDDSGDDDVTPPDDSGDDDVTPPDDSGDDDDTPPDDSVITFSNGVTIDKGKDTLTFDSFKLDNGSVLEGAVWNYSEQDNQWQLTTADGKTLNVTGWDVTDANAAVIEGTQENGLYWKYDSRGYLIIADDNTTVISGDDQAHNSDRGMDISGQDRTGVIISGDRTVNTLTGDSSVTDGATGMVISGDGTTNTISGHSTVDNATGALISGNGTTTNFAGDIAVSGGGTAIIIDGDNATIKNTGTSNISGAGSTGTVIDGNNARVNNDGDMTITDGGTGGHITGDNVVIDNAGSTTVSGADATALYIEGDNALVINEGNQTISGGAVGTRIDGDDAHTTNTGDIAVDGAGSAAVIINGDNGSLTQAGDLLVTDGAMGIITYGTGNEAKNTGNATVRDADSVGFVVAGEKNTFKNKGDIDVSLNGTGALVSGDMSQVTLDGDINVVSVQDSEGVFSSATGVNVSGDNNAVDITGSVNISADYGQDDLAAGAPPLTGVVVGGNGNTVTLNGALNIDDNDLSATSGQYLDVVGLSVTGDDNDVEIDGVTGQADELVGMAALNGGVVINDTSGVINIDADYGQAFLSDSSSYIINNGSINLNGSPMDDTDSHMGGTPTDKIWIQSLPGSGDSDTRTSDTGFFTAGTLANYGTETLNGDVDVNGGWLYNEAGASLTVNGTVTINGGANALANYGTLDADAISTWHSLFNEADGSITTDLLTLNGDVTFYNNGDFTGSIAGTSYQQEIVNTGDMTVAEDGKSLVSGSFYFYNEEDATLTNSGSAVEGGENTIINLTRANDSLTQVNSGTITATNGYSAITTVNGSNDPKWIWNTATGVINGINPDAPLINLGRGYNFGNQGTINVQGDNAVAISGGTSSYVINLVNSGTINVGTEQGKEDGTNGTGLIGIKGNGNATTINNTADGVINVYADDSYAFGGTTKAIINNGEINLLCDSGCDIYAPGTTGTQNDHNGTADIAIPDATTAPTEGSIPTPPEDPNAPQQLSNYIVGTNADGSSGTLKANNLVIGDNVKVDTGFTSGTADTTVVVDNAFTGSNIQGADNITSTSVVWNAQGSQDADGNVDVTMTKNAYADVATDGSVSDVAQALDAGYTNNELYTSLNVGTTAELNSALKQVSGAQATTVFREARVLSNRFTMLADAAPQIKDGLAFNVVAKGDPRAELGNDTQYDMLALRQTLDLTASQNLTLEYGIARLDGDGSKTAGDNGLTGGYSQFFGLKHSMAFDEGLAWNNSLRYDVHNLDSSRSVAYGDVNKIADSDMRQQYLEFRSEGAKTFTMMSDTLKVTPYAGVKFRHTMEDGYKERSAGDFNLSMNSGNETAVDSIVGLKLDYAGKDGWSATATLEGGPNLSYSKSQRTASLQGAAGQSFGVDDGQKGGGINGLATIGVKYSSNDTALHLDAYQWKEDSISDKGFMLNVKKTFR